MHDHHHVNNKKGLVHRRLIAQAHPLRYSHFSIILVCAMMNIENLFYVEKPLVDYDLCRLCFSTSLSDLFAVVCRSNDWTFQSILLLPRL